ncbi:MAG: hypothetical protein KGM98_12725 [Bacteroidota bacterium]|nr:hypothetical protein [Bacteroidota bacterium]
MSYTKIAPLIITGKNPVSKWLGYLGLGIGVLLLLLSMQMFVNIHALLTQNNTRQNGYDFISISKTITNENMGKDNRFTQSDIDRLKGFKDIQGVAPLISNQFRVRATAGDLIPFSTDLFLESINRQFIDTVPDNFTWEPGQVEVPIIFSSDFLEMYNVFAPAQGLPQLSPRTLSSVNIILECSGPKGAITFRGNIVALSDRINSILVPRSFMNWTNMYLSGDTTVRASRVFIKTRDANNPALISFLDQQHYHLNQDKIKFSRIRAILQNIVSVLGVFGVLVIAMALMLFSFYLQLVIARSKDHLRLLLTLGYSPRWLASSVARTWLPVYLTLIGLALLLTQAAHLYFVHLPFVHSESLSPVVHWSVWLTSALLLVLSIYFNTRLVRKELSKII